MSVLEKRNSNTKSLACMSLVRPVLECGASCWDPYREGQIHALDRLRIIERFGLGNLGAA